MAPVSLPKLIAAAALVALALAGVVVASVAPTHSRLPVTPEPAPRGFVAIAPTPRPRPTSPDGFREIALRPTRDYDFAAREQILGARVEHVRAEPALFEALGGVDYEPCTQVFGSIVSGKPWWGLVGLAFHGAGERSIEGDSEESRFIENPYLLASVREVWANVVSNSAGTPRPVYPRPLYLAFDDSGRRGWARFDVTSFFSEGARLDHQDARDRTVKLTAYNATDLGLRFLSFDLVGSRDVDVASGDVIRNPEFIHVGGSCGYKGGCNNMSPLVKAYVLHVSSLPARLSLKLWRMPPPSASAPPDVWFVLELL
jgi:hypothetical protein